MKWQYIVFIVVGGIILLYLFFLIFMSFYISYLFAHPKYLTREEQTKLFESLGREKYPELKREPFELKMSDGYIINGDVSLNDPKKFMICIHGHGSTREGALKYAGMYFKLGYSIVLFDLRGHGDNKRVTCTMGKQESKDLVEIIHYVKETYGEDIVLGIHGTSLGGATLLLSTKYQQEAKFIIADCPYSSLKALVWDMIIRRKTRSFILLGLFGLVYKMLYHASYKDTNVAEAVKTNEIPTLFLHGAQDTFIYPYHSNVLFNANKGIKQQHIFPHGTHGESVFKDPKEYIEVVTKFVKDYEK